MSTKIAVALAAALLIGTASTASASVHGGRQGGPGLCPCTRIGPDLPGPARGYAYPGYAYPYAYGTQVYNQYIAHLGDAGALPGPND
jgi:hypothetical protein